MNTEVIKTTHIEFQNISCKQHANVIKLEYIKLDDKSYVRFDYQSNTYMSETKISNDEFSSIAASGRLKKYDAQKKSSKNICYHFKNTVSKRCDVAHISVPSDDQKSPISIMQRENFINAILLPNKRLEISWDFTKYENALNTCNL